MSMQNLAASSAANLQLFSKALQESAQQGGDGPDGHQVGQNQTAISAADLQQFMLSQLDQQLYLSQLTSGFGTANSGPETSTSSTLFLPANSDSAPTTASNGTAGGEGEMILKAQLKGDFGASSSNPTLSAANGDPSQSAAATVAAQLVQQNLMEQLLEAAAGGGTAAPNPNNPLDPQNGAGNQTAEEIGQLMAQLIAANGGGPGADQLQNQLAQYLANVRGEVQSPSQQQGQLSLLDQLQVLQLLGGQGNVAGLADFLAGNGGGQFTPNSMGHELGGAGMKGGSPNKDADNYCDICNKNVCNRYFLKTHKEKKHGIYPGGNYQSSPTKFAAGLEVRQFFGNNHMEEPGRAQSASLQQQQQQHQRDSPSYQHQRQKQSLSSTPGLGGSNPPASSSLNDSLSADHQQQQQLMSQCIMQQLAAQLGIPSQNGQERPVLIEQILGGTANLPLAELLQQNGQLNGRSSPSQSPGMTENFPCAHCSQLFPSQSALFQHQLTEHIGSNESAQSQLQQQEQALRWSIGEMGGAANQQQLLGQLLGSPTFPGSNNAASLMLPSFGQLNVSDMDSAAMLAKISAELAAVQGGGQGAGLPQHGALLQQNGSGGGGQQHMQQNKILPQKRQYQSTSKNFCDLCNKDVCNKYFLRTHMLKMHNIVIDENKLVIANIDTAEKERRGEIKFRCEICGQSMQTRELLKLHKREVHGMQPIGPHPLHTPPSSKSSTIVGPRISMETADGIVGRKLSSTGTFPLPTFGMGQAEHHREHAAATAMKLEMGANGGASAATNDENDQPMGPTEREEGGGEGTGGATSALPSSVKQLLSQLIASNDPQLSAQTAATGYLQMQNNNREDADAKQQEQNVHRHPNDANNNAGSTSCRFCGICLESEQELELHQLVSHLDLVHSGLHPQEAEEKLVTQVALQMAEANSQKAAAAMRKSSAASSGASSSSSSSSSTAPSASSSAHHHHHHHHHHPQPSPSTKSQHGHPCGQCKRTYKTVANLEAHQRMVHHNFVAKISPLKRTIKISPKKISKMLNCFTCMKCQRRFGTKMECNEHVIFAHIRPEHEDGIGIQSPTMKRAKMNGEEESQELLREWVREEEEAEEGEENHENLGRLVVDEGELDGHEEGKKDGGECDGDGKVTVHHHHHRQTHHQQKQCASGKEGGEKHSHTSGSTSPVSVQASSSSLVLPEGFAHPHPEHQKPFLIQSFTVRPLPSADGTETVQQALPEELVAYLPVRSTLNERVRVTLELQPNPLVDSQVRHL